jgi:hypothetical protein
LVSHRPVESTRVTGHVVAIQILIDGNGVNAALFLGNRGKSPGISLQPFTAASNSLFFNDIQKVYIYLDNKRDSWYFPPWSPRNLPLRRAPAPNLLILYPFRSAPLRHRFNFEPHSALPVRLLETGYETRLAGHVYETARSESVPNQHLHNC